MSKRLLLIVGSAAALLLIAGAWAVWTFRSAEQELQAARGHLEQARSALEDYDTGAAEQAVSAAKVQTDDAVRLTNRWIWRAAAAVPKLGDSAEAARALVLSTGAAVDALVAMTDSFAALDLKNIVKGRRVDLASVTAAGEAAGAGADTLAKARAYLADSPRPVSGGWVLPVIEDARAELSSNLTSVADTVDSVQKVGELLPAAMGAEGSKTYFVGVQAPNETRGTGGLLGTWAVVRADKGKISVIDSGENEDLPDLGRLPRDLGAEFRYRYRDDPILVPNMNLSPDFPVAARLWLDSYEKKTGIRLDGALSLDVIAVGELLKASGDVVGLPGGGTLDGSQFADFALRGIYDRFPTYQESVARREYQSEIGDQVTQALVSVRNPEATLRAMVGLVGERRVAFWSGDPELQQVLADSSLGHGLQPAVPHSVAPVLINMGWSKLDGYIERRFDYQVGRCPSSQGMVRSELTVRLKSAIPPGVILPEYMVGTVPEGPSGPINQVLLQTHLPAGAEVVSVTINGRSGAYLPFEEAGRPAAGVEVALPPRRERIVKLVFDEPSNGAAGQVEVQPMAREATVTIGERPC